MGEAREEEERAKEGLDGGDVGDEGHDDVFPAPG